MNRAVILAFSAFLAGPFLAISAGPAAAQGGPKSTIAGENLPAGKPALGMPLAIFVTAQATGFGMYAPRNSTAFEPGEKLRFYIEPQGYTFQQSGDQFSFGVILDLVLKSKAGDVLYRKDAFLKQDFLSHHKNRELMLNGDLNINGAPSGEYVLVLTLHDIAEPGAATAELPFTIR